MPRHPAVSSGVRGKPMNLRTRLFALVILVLLPIVGVEVYDEIEARRLRAEEGKDQALRLVRLVAQDHARMVEGARQLLTALGKVPVIRTGEQSACNAFLGDLAGSYSQYVSLLSIDPTGRLVCLGGRAVPASFLGDRSYFRLAIETRGLALGEYEVDPLSHQKAFYIAQPYLDTEGKVSGIVAAGLSLDWLNAEIARNPLPPMASVSVIDRQGTILARYPNADQFVGARIAPQSHAYLLSGREGVQEAVGFDGIVRIYSYTPLPGDPQGLTLSVGLDKGEILKGSEAVNRRDIMVIAGSCILALLLAGIGARAFISRPIRILLRAAEHGRQGDFQTRVRFPESRSEFGRLGAAFDAMAAAAGAREQELERRVEERTDALKESMAAQKATEAALHESRKIETVGRLTGGVAHDFNNLLAAIVGNIELARSRLRPGHPSLPRLDAAMQSAKRGAALIQQLLAFARRQNLHPAVVDLNSHINAAREMLQRLLRSDVTVELRLAPEVWLVRVDPNQLEAAILNLAINARDAMPNGGKVALSTMNVHLMADSNASGLDGDFVALTVLDTGTGISPEILEEVFEPFFTTKAIGAGSGLGLSMVQGFAEQSSGSVAIQSVVGQGTSVTLYLPRTTDALSPVIPETEESIGGEGCVLLVDDDASVRQVTAELLELSGYSVLTADTAIAAIACFEREGGRIDILVSDLVLAGGLDGIGLAAVIRSKRPGLPVLLITGYSDALVNWDRTDEMPVLTKPFDHLTLARVVRDAMRNDRR